MTLEQLGWFLLINIPLAVVFGGGYWIYELLRQGSRP